MNADSDFRSYLKALIETPVSIILFLLDIAGIGVVLSIVVDDVYELLVVIVFVVVLHVSHYLIFKKQRLEVIKLLSQISELENLQPRLDLYILDENQSYQRYTIIVPELPEQPDYDAMVLREEYELKTAFQNYEHLFLNFMRHWSSARRVLVDITRSVMTTLSYTANIVNP